MTPFWTVLQRLREQAGGGRKGKGKGKGAKKKENNAPYERPAKGSKGKGTPPPPVLHIQLNSFGRNRRSAFAWGCSLHLVV